MDLGKQAISAVVWISSAKALSQALSWLITIILARILMPEDFGLLAMAFVLIGFLDIMGTFGMGAAIIQKESLDEIELHTVFWVCLLLGFIYYWAVYFLAPIFAGFFNQEKLTQIIRTLGISFPILGLKAIPYNLLTKALEFRKRSSAELYSVLGGGLCSVVLAIRGEGVMSLVYGTLVRYAIQTTVTFCFRPWLPRMCFSLSKTRRLISFGGLLVGSWVLEYLNARSATIIVGKALGDIVLGYYTMATQLAMIPVEKVTSVVNQVTFPVFSKLQRDKQGLRKYFMKVTKFLAMITFPALSGMVLVSDSLIEIVLGEKWLPIRVPLQMLCFVGIMRSVDQIIPGIFMAERKPGLFLKYTGLCIIVLPVSVLVGCSYGLSGATAAVAISYPGCAYYLLRAAGKELEFSLLEYLENIAPAVIGSAVMLVSVFGFKKIMEMTVLNNPLYLLIGSILVGTISYLVVLNAGFKGVRAEIISIVQTLRAREVSGTV